MAEQSSQAPQITDTFSDLQSLTMKALRMYGDQAPESADASLVLMFLDFGNEIIEEVRQHPYWDASTPINYFKSQTDKTTIPDGIMTRGLLAKYAQQQNSDRASMLTSVYFKNLNTILWNRKAGNTAIAMTVVDGGSNPRYTPGYTDPITGNDYKNG